MEVMLGGAAAGGPRSYDSVEKHQACTDAIRAQEFRLSRDEPTAGRQLDVRVLRVYHAGRSEAQRAREQRTGRAGGKRHTCCSRGLAWPGGRRDAIVEPRFELIELEVVRAGDVNRHRYRDPSMLARVIADVRPDVLDVHEEPFSVAARQWLSGCSSRPPDRDVHGTEHRQTISAAVLGLRATALRRVVGLYPCSRQAASVARAKGFAGIIRVIPLGFDAALFRPGRAVARRPGGRSWSVRAPRSREGRPGSGPCACSRPEGARRHVSSSSARGRRRELPLRLLGDWVSTESVQVASWRSPQEVASLYRSVHVLLCRASRRPRGRSNSAA